jgi:phenylacetate-CoA ligase
MQELKVDQKELEKRVKHVVSLSKEIPWYVRKYKELGIDPDEIRSPQDLLKAYEKGLYTTKDDLPDLVTNYNVFRQYYVTSGTTGRPAIVQVTPDDMKRDQRQCRMGYSIFISENDKILNCFPSPPVVSGEASKIGLASFPIKLFHVPSQTLRDVDAFLNYRNILDFNVIFGLTTSLYRLPVKLSEKGVDARYIGIEKIMTAGEPSSIERRKKIGEEFGGANILDWYASTENFVIAYEENSFSNEYRVTIPETLLFLTDDKNEEVNEAEIGDVILTNLYEIGEKPGMVLLNYRIGDSAKCLKKKEGMVTHISDIKRESAYLSGAKLNPIEIEKILEKLNNKFKCFTGEYVLINYHHPATRKAILEVRAEVISKVSEEEKERIAQKIEEELYSANLEVKTAVKDMGDAEILVKLVNEGELYKDFEKIIKPGKPKRLLVM